MKKFFLRVGEKAQGLEQAMRDLLLDRHRHDVLEYAVRALELDLADDSVGFGGFPNIMGEMELDGAFMDGDSRALGAIASVKNYLPVRLARRLMEKGIHTLLAGEGAALFARECGFGPDPTLSAKQREEWQKKIKPLLDKRGKASLMETVELVRQMPVRARRNFDTTVMIASDGQGLSAAASTSGWPYKFPGRVGDTPVAGAGFYVDSRYGAAACTHTGEMAMRAGTARYIVARMEAGLPPQAAVHDAIEDLKALSGGVRRELVIHAVDRDGNAFVAAINTRQPVKYQFWRDDMRAPQVQTAKAIQIKWK